jgi:hypothetical protein
MSKKVKLKLEKLKVHSFETTLNNQEKVKIMAGDMQRTVDPEECWKNYTEICTNGCQNSFINTCYPICVV